MAGGRRARWRPGHRVRMMNVMRFRSTRDAQLTAGFGEALEQGLAPDGGLYVPTEWPRVQAGSFGMRESLAGIGAKLLALRRGRSARAVPGGHHPRSLR